MGAVSFCNDSVDSLSSGQVQAQAARTIAFLHLIESTIQRLTSNTEFLRTAAREVERFNVSIRASEPLRPLDPEGRACLLLDQAAETAERVYNRAVRECESARGDGRLTSDDGVVDAFEAEVEAVADFHNQVVEMREAVLLHNARALGPSGRVYADVDEMFADIASGP